jgi:hypothetical protein
MKPDTLLRMLIFTVITVILNAGTMTAVIASISRSPGTVPCLGCSLKSLQWMGFAEVLLGIVAIGLIKGIRNGKTF